MSKFKPSNGTEGMWFTSFYCENCRYEKFMHTNNHEDHTCDILNRTMIHDVNDDEYPSEWTYDDDDQPTCTKHKFWD